MRNKFKLIALGAAFTATLGLTACDRNDKQTVGQGLDKAIEKAKDKGEEAKSATDQAARSMASAAADAAITLKVNGALMADT